MNIDALVRNVDAEPARDEARAWVEGVDLLADRSCWVPLECVVLDAVAPRSNVFSQTSNGLAAGNTMAEALVHAICELIERDSYTLWQTDPEDPDGSSTQLDLSTIDDPQCRLLLDLFDAADLLVAVHDMTSDLGIPSYTCLISDRPGNFRALGYEYGAGTHLAPEIALSRALTEAAQSRLTTIAGSRDDITPEHYAGRDDDDLADLEQVLARTRPRVRFDRPSLATDSLAVDVEVLLARIAAVGVTSVVAVDLTRPEIGVPVVKVVATELEGPFGSPANVRQRARASVVG